MKQLLALITIILIQGLLTGCISQSKYPVGKDTVLLVGDGKYQIGRFPDDTLKLEMFDGEHGSVILDENVVNYKKTKSTLYVIGNSYTVVSGETNTCRLFSSSKNKIEGLPENQTVITYINSYDNFSDTEKKIFDKLIGKK